MFSTAEIAVIGGIFLFVACGSLLIFKWLTPDDWQRRVDVIRGCSSAKSTEDARSKVKRFVQVLGKWSGDDRDSGLPQQLAQAGYREPSAVAIFGGTRILLSIGLLLAAWYLAPSGWKTPVRNFVIVTAAAVGFYSPRVVLFRKVQARKHDLACGLPNALDMITIAVDAGLGLDAAIMRATQRIGLQSDALRWELEVTWMEVHAGVPRAAALRNLAVRTGVEDINLLVTLLNSADQLGVAVGETLRNFSATLRLKRQQRAEEVAAKVPIKLIFPLALFILPVLMILLLGPAAIQIMRTLTSIHGGNA